MPDRAKIFPNGASQAVRLPQAYRFPEGVTEVIVRRDGPRVILEPIDEWSPEFLAVLGSCKDFPILERPSSSPPRDPFE